jgi:enoyl-CoA hydratase
MADVVFSTVEDGIAVLTINRPEARNAINGAVARSLAAQADEMDARTDVSVIILTGAGGYFSSGMDLKGFLTGDLPTVPGRGFGGLVERPPVKPVIAAVEGYALAGGFELVLSCDLVAAAGGLLRLPRRIPYHLAMEIALTGEHFSAPMLREAGLISSLVPAGGALEAARALAVRVAKNAPLALAATKRVVVESADWPADEAFAKQGAITAPVFTSADAREGALAFAERRAPQWKGE